MINSIEKKQNAKQNAWTESWIISNYYFGHEQLPNVLPIKLSSKTRGISKY